METPSSAERLEGWLRLYEGQIEHARHHENMRSQATNVVVVISAAMLAFVASDFEKSNLPSSASFAVGLFIVIVNLYGWLMSLKHYERSRLHVDVASRYRAVVSEMISNELQNAEEARRLAHKEHSKMLLTRVRANWLWSGLHILIGTIGAAIAWNGFGS
ncbi:MAG TPA: hypothetical protein DHV74_00625 [Sulfitobacter sp.]|uniref:hypothetical protein n=1 Tax=uncultured Parvibaculum sp. TaxID=291828 RepID=UPI000EB8B47A|nr:hypothetical protein [Sulfitobacter sp.]|tara:strand:- start:2192 stop:2671 length:480 start_codon:yes stop_codon:yes gene_type:complete